MASGKNYGYGRDMGYAGRQVLQDRFGGGHFATVATQGQRWTQFAEYMRAEHNIRDMRQITQEHAAEYVVSMRARNTAIKTMHNAISAINVTLGHASAGVWQSMSPADTVGASRCDVRESAPASLDRESMQAARDALAETPRAAAVYGMALATGMRAREASLANYDRLSREAAKLGSINITDGTKGGRTAPRWVVATPQVREAIAAAIASRPEGSLNMLASGECWKQWRDGELRTGREALHSIGVPGYHDARAAYACQRYEQVTGHAAPCVNGARTAPRCDDRTARTVVSHELGHGRSQVAASYVGSAR